MLLPKLNKDSQLGYVHQPKCFILFNSPLQTLELIGGLQVVLGRFWNILPSTFCVKQITQCIVRTFMCITNNVKVYRLVTFVIIWYKPVVNVPTSHPDLLTRILTKMNYHLQSVVSITPISKYDMNTIIEKLNCILICILIYKYAFRGSVVILSKTQDRVRKLVHPHAQLLRA